MREIGTVALLVGIAGAIVFVSVDTEPLKTIGLAVAVVGGLVEVVATIVTVARWIQRRSAT